MARLIKFDGRSIALLLSALELAEKRAIDDLEGTPHLPDMDDAEKIRICKNITAALRGWRELAVMLREGGTDIDLEDEEDAPQPNTPEQEGDEDDDDPVN